ncbi:MULTISPECIES: WD40/YVTN/BNR-like repeat-containing protein [unclassified Marinobacter]|uniref:WD40/YVTN/BNR-like repeat-containing protein n=1 Tax=unclassified Marinobacter TaxID=83889 RepID=UPI001E45C6CD|nr:MULTISPECIES: YCF48-related protein [unclassified Marinobacter]MCE0759656.1 YCF48-related protein [Marinobacter sp. G11]
MANRFMCETLGSACLGLSMALAAPAAFALTDIIETPALMSDLAPESLLNDATRAGDRIVAVGERGHVIYSDDEGQTWTQAEVPVSVTLNAVDFGSDSSGWVVGHSGVVLHSGDAGATWQLQFDGLQAAELVIESREEQIAAMEERIEQAPEAEKGDLEWALDDLFFALENVQADMEIGPVNPLLDVWFENDQHGFVVGAYGMVLRTQDGGETWEDWGPQLSNPQNFHLNSVARVTGGALVIVGEAGQVHVSVDNGDTWERRESPYDGSLFGVMGTGKVNEVLAFGLRGNTMLSTDLGRSWTMVANEGGTTLNNGSVADDGRVTLVGNSGAVLMSSNGGESFRAHFRNDREGVMGVVPLSGTNLLLVGEGGVMITDSRGRDL